MKNYTPFLAFLTAALLIGCQAPSEKEETAEAELTVPYYEQGLEFATVQLSHSLAANTPPNVPRSIHNDSTMRYGEPPKDWTTGFYPGSLWYLYEYTGEEKWKKAAHEWTVALESAKDNTKTHDVGFMIYCSYGHGWRLTQDSSYLHAIVDASESLITRFNPTVGCIKSWDRHPFSAKWQYPVIIDNMMNLEMLYFASTLTGNPKYADVATTHAKTTLNNHFRDDFSSYHVVDYDSTTGTVIQKNTHQGAFHESAWARGQTWGLYGYTLCFRETGDSTFLNQARGIASYIMNHPNLPNDGVPYWDHLAPKIPDEPRDASAAALCASALLELKDYVDEGLSKKYVAFANKVLHSLSGPEYLAEEGENFNFLLMHCTGNYPEDSEIDKPLNYGDYYYLEALTRMKNLKDEKN